MKLKRKRKQNIIDLDMDSYVRFNGVVYKIMAYTQTKDYYVNKLDIRLTDCWADFDKGANINDTKR